ncbi:archaeal proteasome endopeptidase complex subunit alpha [Halobellus limi]|jgi:proteasome alpha subunit|uniref:Proteasome subunit alpha n=1 Tax=Halobellus limi TaxID=699433 RepID=A0A1H5ZTR4_9EURY|nr:archaeal proteasome endopeptidase complex subunit alpha [Halobellus limi]QCC47970.1 proteasome endopeptidase complex, archaeal, alpha subunit [Halobellus limi]SEG39097.1 proteasome alpha subunit [Halobellus limi]
MNRNDQQAYDRGTSLFSPDGRIYQVEYAREAVKRGAPSLGIRTAEGVVLAAQRRTSSPLMEGESIEKLHKLDDFLGAASAGHVADARRLIDGARTAAQRNRLRYGEPLGVETLTKTLSDEIQETTQYGGTRPFGAALLIAGMDDSGSEPRLYQTDPSGAPQEWRAVAIGSGRDDIQEFLESNWSEDLSIDDGVEIAVRSLLESNDDLDAESVTVATVTTDGYRVVSDDEIADVIDEYGSAADADDTEDDA